MELGELLVGAGKRTKELRQLKEEEKTGKRGKRVQKQANKLDISGKTVMFAIYGHS